MAILQDITKLPDYSTEAEELRAELVRLTAENQALKANQKQVKNGLKVSEKGAVSMYGYGRFPITVYAEALEDILSRRDEIRAWMAANKDKLSVKDRG
jgi:hypothetical protein